MNEARKIKVVRIIARLNVGGPAKHVVWLTAGLRDLGFDTLLVAGRVPEGEEDMGYFATELGVEPYYIQEMSREISPKDAITIWKLFRLFVRERPDIIHTHTAKAGTVGRIAGFLYRWLTPAAFIGQPRACKFVHTYHGHIFHSYYGAFKTRVFVFVEKCLARVVTHKLLVVSNQQQNEIANDFHVGKAGQFRVVPLGLDLKVFDNSYSRRQLFRRELGIADDVVLVGIVGRLTEIKNHELFLRSVARFKELVTGDMPATRFVVIGDGAQRQQLADLAGLLGLKDDVVFVGSRKDPQNFYPALDVVALTSRNEGTPLTLIEGMANSRPVIATAVGGVVDLLGEPLPSSLGYLECTRGVSVRPSDEKAFAEGLVNLIRDVDLRNRLGQNGRDFVRANYTRERLIEDIKGLYNELVNTQTIRFESRSTEHSIQSGA